MLPGGISRNEQREPHRHRPRPRLRRMAPSPPIPQTTGPHDSCEA